MQLQNYTFLHLVYTVFFAAWVLCINIFGSTVDTRSYVSLWRWRDLKILLRWSCLHFGFAADYLQSRSSILVKTIRHQCRSTQDSLSSQELTFLLVLAILDEGNALDGHSFHPPGEQSSLCFRRPFDTRVHGLGTPFSTPLC